MAIYQYRNTGTNQVVYVQSAVFAGNPLWELIAGPGSGGGDVTQADLDALESDTTDVHGVADFSELVTDDEANAKVVAHSYSTDPHGDRSYTDTAVGSRIPLTQKGQANGVATLGSDSKIPAAQVPAIALTDYLGPTANQAAMLALVPAQLGDWTIRTDLSTTWVISGADATQLSNWNELGYPNAVTSVAGKTGIVTLAGEDITSGTLATARLSVGTGAGTVAAGDDPRFSAGASDGHRLVIFYAPPQVVNGTFSNEAAAAVFAGYDQIVFGAGLAAPGHAYYASTVAIVARIKQLNTRAKVYGYIDMGLSAPSIATMKATVDLWVTVGVDGILFDTVEYAYAVHRSTMNEMVNYCHGLNLGTIINGFQPADVMGSAVNATYNPSGTPTAMDERDYYLMESWVVNDSFYSATDGFSSMATLKAKGDLCRTYRASLGVKMMATGLVDYSTATAAELDLWWHMHEAACLVWGIDSYGLSPTNYSATGSNVGVVRDFDYWPELDNRFNASTAYAINAAVTEATRADLGVVFHDDTATSTYSFTLPPLSYHVLPVGTAARTVAAGNDIRITGAATAAALTSGLAGKVAKTEVSLNVRDYGAVGDCAFVDQRVTGAWGLASATIVNAPTYGRGYANAAYTLAATDNTTAFRAAWDALVDEGRLSLREKSTGVYTGYRGQRRELHIPAGSYYISDAGALFSYLRTSPNGTQAGLTVRGDGQENTVLYVRIPNAGATDYMVYDVDKINRFEMRDLTIVCTTGDERLFYTASSTGQTGRWYFQRVSFWEYKTCFTLAGTVNADRWVLDACDWQTAKAGATLFTNSSNSQAVDYVFNGASITHFHGGNVFNIAAGGNVKLVGGCSRVAGAEADGAEGVLVRVDGTGGLVGQQTYPAFTAYGHRLELVDSGGLCDINISEVMFRDCIAFPTADVRTKPHCIVRTTGRVVWDGGIWGDLTVGFSNSYLNDYQLSNKASMYIRNAKIKNNSFLTSKVSYFTDAGDGLTTVFGTTGTGGPARGRIFVEGCDPYGVTYGTTRILQNGAPYAWYGWHGRPAKVHREIMRQGSALGVGLGDETQSSSVIIPTQCEIIRVGIVKGSGNVGIGGNSRTWSIRDADATTLVSLTALGTDTWVKATADINRVVSTINTRTLSLVCAASSPASNGTYADGYWFVEYV